MYKIISATIALGSIFVSLSAGAESIELPVVKSGDSWTYKSTVEKGQNGWMQKHTELTVIRASASSILVSTKESGSSLPPKEQLVGRDWSRFRNINGKEIIVNQPLVFPLTLDKSWETEYTEDHPNKQHKKEQFHMDYTVVGWEEVDVPAGKFRAIKIEADGKWKAELEPSIGAATSTHAGQGGATIIMQTQKVTAQTATGRLYKAFWYVPEVKRFVKTIEEYYDAGDVRNERFTDELESFRISK